MFIDFNVVCVYVVWFVCWGIENNMRMVIFECRNFNVYLLIYYVKF